MNKKTENDNYLANVKANLSPLVNHLHQKPSPRLFQITCIPDAEIARLSVDPRKDSEERVAVNKETSSNARLWLDNFFYFLSDQVDKS